VRSLKKPLKRQNNTTTSTVLSTQSSKSAEVGQRLTDPNRLGDVAEFYAITWLWDEGFEVYHNSGCSGAVDIVGIKDGEVYLFDVKMNKNPKKSTAKSRTPIQKKLGVQFLLFDPYTRKLRLQKHKE
jgi:hypothetical protein